MPWLQNRGFRLVERSHLKQIFREQKIRLTHTSEDEADLLHVGRLIGAEQVVFVMWAGDSVSVRGVDVQSGEVSWSGTAPTKRVEDIQRATRSALKVALGEQ